MNPCCGDSGYPCCGGRSLPLFGGDEEPRPALRPGEKGIPDPQDCGDQGFGVSFSASIHCTPGLPDGCVNWTRHRGI